jgi:hypothetical protein
MSKRKLPPSRRPGRGGGDDRPRLARRAALIADELLRDYGFGASVRAFYDRARAEGEPAPIAILVTPEAYTGRYDVVAHVLSELHVRLGNTPPWGDGDPADGVGLVGLPDRNILLDILGMGGPPGSRAALADALDWAAAECPGDPVVALFADCVYVSSWEHPAGELN